MAKKSNMTSRTRGARADQSIPGVLVQDQRMLAPKYASGATGKQAPSTVAGVLARNASESRPDHKGHQRETAAYVAALKAGKR